jgi:hypothetical protein
MNNKQVIAVIDTKGEQGGFFTDVSFTYPVLFIQY